MRLDQLADRDGTASRSASFDDRVHRHRLSRAQNPLTSTIVSARTLSARKSELSEECSGGIISVKSEEGSGSVFTVTLPRRGPQ